MKTGSRSIATLGILMASFAGCSGEVGPSDERENEDFGGAGDPLESDIGTLQQAAIVGTVVNTTPVYSGIWSAGAPLNEALRFNRTTAELVADNTALAATGLRLTSLTSNVVDGAVRYSGIWNFGVQTQRLRTGLTPAAFNAEYATLFFQGFRLGSLTTFNADGQLRVSAVFNASLASEVYAIGRTQSQLIGDILAQALFGNQIVSLTATVVGSQTLYSGIWKPSPVITHVRTQQTFSEFSTEQSFMALLGHRLISLSITAIDGVPYYHSVFAPSPFADLVYFPANQVDFASQNASNRSAGYRLRQIVANVEALNLTQMADQLRDAITPASTGFAATIAAGALRERRVGGVRRTAADPPQRNSTNTDVMNLASVSKTITAAAAQRALADNTGPNTTLDSPMSVWLPASWVRGPNINGITMRELLTHRSGIRATNVDDYAGLQTTVANGINLDDKTYCYENSWDLNTCYRNHNFALFRLIVPYLTGYNGTGDIDLETSTRFLDYVNTKIIAPSGAGTATTIPPAFEPTLYYTFPDAGIPGTSWGDGSRFVGGGGLHLSSDQLATVLVERYNPAVLGGPSPWSRTTESLAGTSGNSCVTVGAERRAAISIGTRRVTAEKKPIRWRSAFARVRYRRRPLASTAST